MLSGYIPSADAVEAVGAIARDLKLKASIKPGSFFWGEIHFSLFLLLSSLLCLLYAMIPSNSASEEEEDGEDEERQ